MIEFEITVALKLIETSFNYVWLSDNMNAIYSVKG